MKKLFLPTLLAFVLLWALSGCNKLFDVPPRAIYSPIDLGSTKVTKGLDSLQNVYISPVGSYTEINTIEVTTVRFTIRDATLKYGAVVFYDSLSAQELIRTGRVSGLPDFYREDNLSQGTSRTVKLRIEPLKGQFQYIVPVGYSQDSIRTFYAQGFIRTKISPWTQIATLNYYATQQYKVRLFQANGKLGYVQYDDKQITCFEFDPLLARWINKASFSANVCKNGCPGRGSTSPITSNVVSNIEMVYFAQNQYRMLVNSNTYTDSPYWRRNGEISTDQNFNYVGYEEDAYSSLSLNYYAVNLQKDVIQLVYERQKIATRPTFPAIDYTIPSGYSKPLAGGNRSYFAFTESIESPTVSIVIGQKLILNSIGQQNQFKVFDLQTNSQKSLRTVSYTNPNLVWQRSTAERLVSIKDGDQAYLLNNNLNIYRVTINADNSPNFQNFYANWFPGNSANAISQGILYKNKLLFLVNDYQLWEFDPSQLTIDFNRPGAVTIVSL